MTRAHLIVTVAVFLAAGCTAGALSPSTPQPDANGGYAVDSSWSRLGRMNDPALTLRLVESAALGHTRRHAPPQDSGLDWQYPLFAPVEETPALYVSGGTENDATDRMFAAGALASDGSDSFFALENLYDASPTVAWQNEIDSDVDGSAIVLTPDATKVFAVTKKGTVYGFNAADGSAVAGFPVAIGRKVSWASPWLDFTTQPYPLYVADLNGRVTRIDTSTGATLASKKICSAIHSSPIVWNGVVWTGCDDGTLHRLNPQTLAEYAPATKLCARASCKANDAIYSAPFIDSVGNRLLIGVNNQLVVVDIDPTTGCTTGTSACPISIATVGKSAIFYSSPFIDFATGYVYLAFNNQLWRAGWDGTALTSGFVATAHALAGSNSDAGYPKSSPLAFNGHVWVGDGGGFVNRYASDSFAFENATPQYGVTVDTTPLIDIAGGNIYFGTNGTVTTAKRGVVKTHPKLGSWVQLQQIW
ncbi:MAG TPA: PQQ-binding-like beta-propeller repeat protein [Polyangia bacterium]|jgi:outer membrane protein assembly factor BamB